MRTKEQRAARSTEMWGWDSDMFNSPKFSASESLLRYSIFVRNSVFSVDELAPSRSPDTGRTY